MINENRNLMTFPVSVIIQDKDNPVYIFQRSPMIKYGNSIELKRVLEPAHSSVMFMPDSEHPNIMIMVFVVKGRLKSFGYMINEWSWRKVYLDGTLGPLEFGKGRFYECPIPYEVYTRIILHDDDFSGDILYSTDNPNTKLLD